jgi:hypothetical protein
MDGSGSEQIISGDTNRNGFYMSAIINTDFTSDQVGHYYHSLKIMFDQFGLHFISISGHSSKLDHIDHFSS